MGIAEFFASVPPLSVVIFFAGIVLLVVEMFHPGFGVAGGLGLLLFVIDILITARTFTEGIILTAFLAALLVVMLGVSIYLASHGHVPKKLILGEEARSEKGYMSARDKQHLLGKTGTTLTTLRPSGNAEFDGARVDVVTKGDFITPGTLVEVVEVEGNRVVVTTK